MQPEGYRPPPTPKSRNPWIWAAILVLALGLLCCCSGGICVYLGYVGVGGIQVALEDAERDSEAYRGVPIDVCWDEAWSRAAACGAEINIACRMGPQMLLMACFQVSEVPAGYCDDKRDIESFCRSECLSRTMPSPALCGATCGQFGTVIQDYCRSR